MYQISKESNSISKIKEVSFSSQNYTERGHLQERIAKTPNIFWEELLIIQKEFDGFSDTRERLDLLAMDTEWNNASQLWYCIMINNQFYGVI